MIHSISYRRDAPTRCRKKNNKNTNLVELANTFLAFNVGFEISAQFESIVSYQVSDEIFKEVGFMYVEVTTGNLVQYTFQ